MMRLSVQRIMTESLTNRVTRFPAAATTRLVVRSYGDMRAVERRFAINSKRSAIGKILLAGWTASVLLGPSTARTQDVTSPGPNRNSHSQSAFEGAKASRLSLSQGVERAETSSGGRAVEAIFTPFAAGGGSHDVVILRPDGMLAHYHLDANEGAFVGVTDKKVASLMTSLTPRAVGGVRVGLLQAIALIEGRAPDRRAIGATASQDGETISYEVTVATPDGDKRFYVDSGGGVSE